MYPESGRQTVRRDPPLRAETVGKTAVGCPVELPRSSEGLEPELAGYLAITADPEGDVITHPAQAGRSAVQAFAPVQGTWEVGVTQAKISGIHPCPLVAAPDLAAGWRVELADDDDRVVFFATVTDADSSQPLPTLTNTPLVPVQNP